jgi:glycerol uptake operon antiterminator
MIKQEVMPVLKTIKDVEQACYFNVEYVVLMDVHIAQLEHCVDLLKRNGKKVLMHLDLIKGLKSDDYAVEYLIQKLDVDGIISVKTSIVEKVKKLNRISVQRLFLIDTQSYNKGIDLIRMSKPDYIELLPGCMGKLIQRVKEELDIQVLAGGLIETVEEVRDAISHGATAITTSNPYLIKKFTRGH